VYASSIAAYGFHRDNPIGITEDWPTRPADRLFYSQEKAELERLLLEEAERHPETDLYLLRPPIVLGPDAIGAKAQLPPALLQMLQLAHSGIRRLRVVPAVVPDLPMQLIHQDDVAEALRLCVLAAGPPGAYNIAADDVVTVAEVVRELGFQPLTVPSRPVAAVARAITALPFLPSGAQWAEVLSHPAIMDTTKAHTVLGWTPRHSALESLRASLPQ
jgi:nucleoside-diphosphate-sugar epimerase